MKKLLVLLFSILISFNSYGEWEEIAENQRGDIFTSTSMQLKNTMDMFIGGI